MPTIKIDGRAVDVREGATILDAARQVGIDIPTLCHLPGRPAQASCFICVVRVNGGPRFVPACATEAVDGIEVESDCPDVMDARRSAIELLLSDHLGDCVAPCQSVCPANMDIPNMLHLTAAGKFHEALVTVKEMIALPATLGRICPELCEKGCRRNQRDGALSVCMTKRYVADVDLAEAEPYRPGCLPDTGKRVAIVGAGAAGLSAAYYLARRGVGVTLYDDHEKPGGMMRYAISEEILPHDVLDAEIATITALGPVFEGNRRMGRDFTLGDLRAQFDAVLLAVGDIKVAAGLPEEIPTSPQGLRVDRQTLMTNLPGVFAAGGALVASRHAVRSVADGRAAAESISGWLAEGQGARETKEFSVHVGKLDPVGVGEFITFMSPEGRTEASGGKSAGFSAAEVLREAQRCLHCECRGASSCKLRKYSVLLGANPNRFRSEERRSFTQDSSHPAVIFESGKCIACGICVRIAAEGGEDLGVAFIGRGFGLRTATPFGEKLAAGLKKTAHAAAAACPTGALIAIDEE